MLGIYASLEIAKRTLLNSQVCVQTASHNLANADNKTYARQKVVQSTNPSLFTREGFMGTGASIDSIVQQRDQFIERRLLSSFGRESDHSTRASHLTTAGAYFIDDGDETGLSQTLSEFWDAWETLSQSPDTLAEKTLVSEKTRILITQIQSVYKGLTECAGQVEGEIKDGVSKINTLLSDIAAYNKEIVREEYSQHSANDLRDIRFQALKELSGMLPVKYIEEANGALTISIQDGDTEIALVSSFEAGSLAYDEDSHEVTLLDFEGSSTTIDLESESLRGGSFGGVLSVFRSIGTAHDLAFAQDNPEDATLTYLDRLNAFTATLITEVNKVHAQAGGSNVFDESVLMGDFKASDIALDPGFEVDSLQALDIAALQNKRYPGELGDPTLGDATFSEYLSDIQQRIGIEQEEADTQSRFQQALREQLEVDQQTISGVSIDEEMVDIMKFQQIYQAAARIIQTSSELLDTVIRMV